MKYLDCAPGAEWVLKMNYARAFCGKLNSLSEYLLKNEPSLQNVLSQLLLLRASFKND